MDKGIENLRETKKNKKILELRSTTEMKTLLEGFKDKFEWAEGELVNTKVEP